MRYIAILVSMLFLFSCKEEREEAPVQIETETLTEAEIDSLLEDYLIEYEPPLLPPGDSIIAIPISIVQAGRGINIDKYFKGSSYKVSDRPRYWNVFFYNNITKSSHLLTQGRLRINTIEIPDKADRVDEVSSKILYQIADEDFDKDGKLTSSDPIQLFASELDGTNLTQISPDNEEVEYIRVLPGSNEILIKTLRDKNGDKEFLGNDEPVWYIAKLAGTVWKLEEVIDANGRNTIEKLFLETWLNEYKEE